MVIKPLAFERRRGGMVLSERKINIFVVYIQGMCNESKLVVMRLGSARFG